MFLTIVALHHSVGVSSSLDESLEEASGNTLEDLGIATRFSCNACDAVRAVVLEIGHVCHAALAGS